MYGEHVRLLYRDIDDCMTFDFVFFDLGLRTESWRIYIIKNIDYGTRPSDGHSTHRLKDEDETYEYICWDGELMSLEDAKQVAADWADCTSRYIRGLRSFDSYVSRLTGS